ncbi:MAG: hypothetical protein M1839_008317 [Geoglossum umbratile]|nr:MAG: hypothetical protein M1839_008317 [Geoglossum umbratile]
MANAQRVVDFNMEEAPSSSAVKRKALTKKTAAKKAPTKKKPPTAVNTLLPLTEGVPITFKVQLPRWRTPYASKHAYNLSFSLEEKTFHVGSWSDKNHWFMVMHPINTGNSNGTINIDQWNSGIRSSALTEDLADTLNYHVRDALQEVIPGLDLQQETMELNYAEWGKLQQAFFSRWNSEFGQDLTLDDENPQALSSQLGECISLSQVETFSFAIAANLYFLEEEPEVDEDYNDKALSTLCCLPELKRREFPTAKARRGLKLFPLAFSSQYGNFQAPMAPQFLLQKYGDPVHQRTSEQNAGRPIVVCSATQGYSIWKQDVRKTPKHFLPTKAFYTGGWAMPEKHLNYRQVVKMQALQSKTYPKSKLDRPILREMLKIQTLLSEGQGNWNHVTLRVFEPLFDFWNNEGPTFRRTVRLFPKAVFPRILLPIGKIMDGALQYPRSEAILHADKHLCTAQAEACSIIERLAAYSKNGTGIYTRSRAFRFLGIRESIKALKIPYISDNHIGIQVNIEVPEEAAESRRLEIEHLDFKEYQFDDGGLLKDDIDDRVSLHLVPELRCFVAKALARHGA